MNDKNETSSPRPTQKRADISRQELRRILRSLYYRELGLPPPDPEVSATLAAVEEDLADAVRTAPSAEPL